MKAIKFVIILLLFLSNANAYEHYSCSSLNSIEQFKKKSFMALQLAFSEVDAVIFNKIFQIHEINEIDNNNDKSVCEVTYKVVPINRAEALNYLFLIGDNYSEFKNILKGLASNNDYDRKNFSNKLKKLTAILPSSSYTAKKSPNGVEIKINKFSIFELFKKQFKK